MIPGRYCTATNIHEYHGHKKFNLSFNYVDEVWLYQSSCQNLGMSESEGMSSKVKLHLGNSKKLSLTAIQGYQGLTSWNILG